MAILSSKNVRFELGYFLISLGLGHSQNNRPSSLETKSPLFQEHIDSRPLHSSPLDFLYFIFLMIPSRYPAGTRWVFQENRINHRCFKNEHFVVLTSLLCSIKVSTNTLCVLKNQAGLCIYTLDICNI